MEANQLLTKEEFNQSIKDLKQSFIEELTRAGNINQKPIVPKWVKNPVVKELLGITSDTTLLRMRKSGILRYARIGGFYLYDIESILEYLEEKSSK
ncbi:helix-turn-helix domain-containing protein [bacterium AH-315-C07]|nr:helix-turn-helix domain-containing protein [bacterium AH-315-C07]